MITDDHHGRETGHDYIINLIPAPTYTPFKHLELGNQLLLPALYIIQGDLGPAIGNTKNSERSRDELIFIQEKHYILVKGFLQ